MLQGRHRSRRKAAQISQSEKVVVAGKEETITFQRALDKTIEQLSHNEYHVRVLLNERTNGQWQIHAQEGFTLIDPTNKTFKKNHYASPNITIGQKEGFLTVNGRKYLKKRLYIKPCSGHMSFNGNQYGGVFLVLYDGKKISLINCIDLEEYVACVLRTESWPGWPLEANKIFAITSRTYVVAMMLDAQKVRRPYHVKNTNIHQTYAGVHDSETLKQAVAQTKGLFISHKNKPITAMFDSCCGGVIPAHMEGINFNDAPYLARPYSCKHCKRCWIYNWQAEFTISDFQQRLTKVVNELPGFHGFKVLRRDKAGLVQEVLLRTRPEGIKLAGKKIYSAFKEVKSFCFSLRKKKGKIIFDGRGYGHHLGLCQWGAREMVRDGWDYKQVLKFYYPGTTFMKLV